MRTAIEEEASRVGLKIEKYVGEVVEIPGKAHEHVVQGTDGKQLECARRAKLFAFQANEKYEKIEYDAAYDQDEAPNPNGHYFAQNIENDWIHEICLYYML